MCAVSRRGSLHGESPSRSGGAAVTGTKLLSRAFHHNHPPPPQPFSSGSELVRVPVCVQVHGHACGYQAVQHTPFPSASPTQWFRYRHSLGRAAHEILWKREASLKGLISMTWTTQHLRFPGRQSWGEDYQGHEDKQSRGMRLGGSGHQAQRKRAILPWRATVKVKTHTEKADRVNCTKGKKEVSLGRVRPWLGRGASGWLLVKEVGQSWLIRA